MIKKLTVAQCDVCGKTAPAKATSGQYNETEYVLPDGWKKSDVNSDFCICDECVRLLNRPQAVTIRGGTDVYEDRRH